MLLDPPQGVPSARTVRENIRRILNEARALQPRPLIIHVRNNGESGEPDQPHTSGWQLALPALPNEPVLGKWKNNAFVGTGLDGLIERDADIVVVGMQSDFCIRATCSAALGRGNNVLLVSGAHATYDRTEDYMGTGPVMTSARIVEREIESELEDAGVLLISPEDVPHMLAW